MNGRKNHVELLLWEPSGVDRELWPITAGVPFPKGTLNNKDEISLTDGKRQLPFSAAVSSKWNDGSIRWLLLDFQTGLAGNEKKKLFLEFGNKTKCIKSEPEVNLHITETDNELTVHNGDIKVVFKRGMPFDEVYYKERLVIKNDDHICMLQEKGKQYFGLTDISRIRIETRNDFRVVVRCDGKFTASDGGTCLDLTTRVYLFAGKPFVKIYHTVTNFERRDVYIEDLSFNIAGAFDNPVSGYITGQGLDNSIHPSVDGRASIGISTVPVPETRYSAEQLAPHVACKERLAEIDDTTEYRAAAQCEIRTGDNSPENIQGESLLYPITASGLICGEGLRLGLACSRFYPQAPKKISVDGKHVSLNLYWNFNDKPLEFWRGTAKTHEISLLIDGEEKPSDTESVLEYKRIILALEETVLPTFGQSNWIQETEVFGPVFKYDPEKYTWMEFMFREMLEKRFYLSSGDYVPGTCVLDYGDIWNPSRGGQWQNNEMDLGGAMILYMLRTGNPRPFPLIESIIHHMIDVDTHHEAADAAWVGAQRYHQVRHGAFSPSLLCHQWLEGPLYYYFLTGYERALEVAGMRAGAFCRAVESGAHRIKQLERVQGWPLVALSTMNEYFPEKRYIDACKSILDWLEQWIKEDGDMIYKEFGPVLEGKGNNTLGRGVICQALAHYHRMTGDERALSIFAEAMKKAVKLVLTPEGLGVKTSFLRRNYYAPGESDFILEAFGYMFELTGEKKWIELGLRNFKLAVIKRNPFSGRIGVGGNCTEAFRFWPAFLYYADKSGMLEDIQVF